MMKKSAVALVLLFLSLPLMAAGPKFITKADGVRGKYVVRLTDESFLTRHDVTSQLVGMFGGKVTHVYEHVFPGFAVELPEAAAMALANHPAVLNVTEVSPIYPIRPAGWGLDRIDQRAYPLNGDFADECAGGGGGVTAYIIDTGINPHAEFGTRLRNGFTATPGNFADTYGHGTSVASIVGGSTVGVARSVELVNVKVVGGPNFTADLIAGIDWIIADHVAPAKAVANISLINALDPNIDDAVRRLEGDGIFVAIGAGNGDRVAPNNVPDNACNYSPQNVGVTLANTMTVSATMRVGNSDARAEASYWSANTGTCVEVFAPGMAVDAAAPTGGFTQVEGTSMAASYVTGQAARMRSGGWGLYVENWIRQNATPNVVANAGAGSPNLLLYTIFSPRCR